MLAAFMATLGRGRWWFTALAGFLVRGGVLALLAGIVVLPTPAELARHLDPSLEGAAPGDITPALVGLVARLLVIGLVIVVTSTAIGTWLDGALIADVAADEELEPGHGIRSLPLGLAIAARLVTHVPTALAVVVGGVLLAAAAYAELLAPSGSAPLVVRIVLDAPAAIGLIVGAWFLAEAWGGAALRRLIVGDGLGAALRNGLALVVRPAGLATLGLTTAGVLVAALGTILAAGRAFERVAPLVIDAADPVLVAIGVSLLVGTWCAGLWLLGVALAFRSAAWTAEVLREA